MPPQPLPVGRTVLFAFLHSWALAIPVIPTGFKIDSLIVTSRMVHPYHCSPYGHPAWTHLINPAIPTIVDRDLVTLHYAILSINAYLSHLPPHLAVVNLLYRGCTCRILVLGLMCCHSTDRLLICCHSRQTLVATTPNRLWLLPLPIDFGCCLFQQTLVAVSFNRLRILPAIMRRYTMCTRISTPVGSPTSF
jgi:hypothetical protein